ncbi:right-handed parallel beta-helix repeat-containing protein [Natrinema longum]|uniref:Right-handed parallel beta-helix repeat-containing protein n=1 Tax=Natrinema longum TaxID=370324 RepID=A0A8A2UCH4_9EURY|nr:right-handed parallel beta-helix repeat-containing protein [Natrinema longum]MBZ6495731.1 right-handed parallel beta-helix repeat-containing protein [Natrinema longum]QSW86310.1 right-handed parallel beta-helix repeat-containing protein [Natrinema longum]
MARDNSVSDDDDLADRSSESGDTTGNNGLLDRRSYLKLTGAASVVGGGLATGSAAAAEEYEVIEASNEWYNIDDGEVFENKIIDFSNGNWFGLYARESTDWTIRNVGFVGTHRHDKHAIAVADVGGNTSTIENVYMGDGCIRPSSYSSHGQCGIWVAPEHSGHIDIRNCNVQDWPNNGIYASAPGYNGNGGTVHIDSCYAANNYVSSYRLSSDGSKCTNSVAYNDSDGRFNGRCFWGWNPGRMTVSGCDFSSGSYNDAIHLGRNGETTRITIEETQFDGISQRGDVRLSRGSGLGSNPDLSMPEGVPTSAEEAASGGTSSTQPPQDDADDDAESSLLNTIVFDGNGTAETTSYEFVVSDAVEPSTDENATIDEAATVDGTRASGTVADYLDAFRFDGQIERLSVDGNATVRVNGVEIDPADIDDVLQNVVLIDGSDEDATRYEFTVTGDVERSTYDGASIDDEDAIEDGTVYGAVADWKDAFRYSGEIEELTVDGPGTVSVNGERVDPSDFGTDLPHVLEVQGTGTPVAFEITVDGEIELAGEESPEDEATTISGSTAQSTVTDDSLRFNFSGVLTDVSLTGGTPTITVDGEEIDLEEYGDPKLLPHAIVFDGTETAEPSTYSFRVDGTVMKAQYRNASIDDGDVVEDTTVRGGVGDWLDAYWFDGDIVDGQVLGDATVDIQYNAREQ